MMKRIAVTGAGGFVGKRFVEYNESRFEIIPFSLREKNISEINLSGIEAIVHLAGKAHQMEPIADKIYFDVNYELTKRFAEKAKREGIGHFIYISSTKVYGDEVHETLDENSPCTPNDAYGASKLKAEEFLLSVQSEKFKTAIIRPPLVYGPGVKGNMIKLLQLASKKIPLPLGNTRNARSMVFIDNLIELINTVIEQKAAGVFIAGDREPIATDKLILIMRKYLGVNSGLLSVPFMLRKLVKKIKPALYVRLFGSFVVNNGNTNRSLNFVPPYTIEHGLEQMVKWYRKTHLS